MLSWSASGQGPAQGAHRTRKPRILIDDMECQAVALKFLGKQLVPGAALGNPVSQCREVIDFLVNQKSRKQFRDKWDKHMLLDYLPESRYLWIHRRPQKPRRWGRGSDETAPLTPMHSPDNENSGFTINLEDIEGQHKVGHIFALSIRSTDADAASTYAFELKRKEDVPRLVKVLLAHTNLIGSFNGVDKSNYLDVASIKAAEAVQNPVNPVSPAAAVVANAKDVDAQATDAGATVTLSQLEYVQLQLDATTAEKNRLVLERDLEKARRQLAEAKNEKTSLAAELASEVAALKSEVIAESTEMMKTLLDEMVELRKGLALIGSKVDNNKEAINDQSFADSLSFWTQAQRIQDHDRPRLTSRMSSAKSTNRLLLLVKRMSSMDTGFFSGASEADTDTGSIPRLTVEGSKGDVCEDIDIVPDLDTAESLKPRSVLPPGWDRSLDKSSLEGKCESSSDGGEKALDENAGESASIHSNRKHSVKVSVNDITREVVSEVELTDTGQGYGFAIGGGADILVKVGDPVIYVTNIVIGGAAHKDGRLQPGDKILSANGQSLQNATHQEAGQIMQRRSSDDHCARNLKLVIARLPIEDTLRIKISRLVQGVVLQKQDADNTSRVIISEVMGDAQSELDGCLQVGDVVLSINDVKIEDNTVDFWNNRLNQLASNGSKIDFILTRIHEMSSQTSPDSHQSTIIEDVVEISFRSSGESLGFGIAGGTDHPVENGDTSVYVTYIAPNGAAEKDGRLRVGDRLIEVNGVNTLNVSHSETVTALKKDDHGVHLIVMRIPEHEEEILDMSFEIGSGGLGFTMYGGIDQLDEPRIVVHRINELGSAARGGSLKAGDEILTVDGEDVTKMTHAEVAEMLGAKTSGRISLRVARIVDLPKLKEVFLDVVLPLPLAGKGWGFSLAGGSDQPIEQNDPAVYITDIIDGSQVQSDGKLKFCDKIVEINGINILNVPHNHVVALLRSSSGPVNMKISRLVHASDTTDMDVVQICFAVQPGQQVGIRIAGGLDNELTPGDSAVYISEILDSGVASLDGRLKTGDKVLVCNDVSLTTVQHADAVQAFLKNPNEIKLTVARRT